MSDPAFSPTRSRGRSRDHFLVICRTEKMKSATLFALGLFAAAIWSHDSARCQTSPFPPLSLAPPASNEEAASPDATNARPPTATAKGSVPPRAAQDVPPRAASRSAAVEHTPSQSDRASPAQAINRPSPSAGAVPDYDGFSVGMDDDPPSRTTRPVRSHEARQPKLNQAADHVSRQQTANPGNDDELKGKLTICRGCK